VLTRRRRRRFGFPFDGLSVLAQLFGFHIRLRPPRT
jgi:hypothetical protein